MVVYGLLIRLVPKLVVYELSFQFVYLAISAAVLSYLLTIVFFHVCIVAGWAVCSQHKEASARHQPV